MDNISHGVLGGSIAGLIGGKKFGKKAYLWGIALANFPDLDVIVGPLLYGDSLQAIFFHRGPMHSFVFILLIAPLCAWVINKIYRGDKSSRWRRTAIARAAMFSHPLLDALTSYGTRLLWPFTDTAYSLNSIFIIDPLYTIPFILFFIGALCFKNRIRRWNMTLGGFLLSIVYLLLGIVLKFATINPTFTQAHIAQHIVATKSFTTPEALQIALWKDVIVTDDDFIQGWYSIFDNTKDITYISIPRMTELLDPYRSDIMVQKLVDKSEGFYIIRPRPEGGVVLIDVRFGGINGWEKSDENYIFGYAIHEENGKIVIGSNGWGGGKMIEDTTFKTWRERVKGI